MTTVYATYHWYVDLNNDGDFADASEDITAYVKHARAQHGVSNAGDVMARSATLDLTLNNDSHIFSPEHASALTGFLPGRVVRWTMTYNATTVTLFHGRMGMPMPKPGDNESRETTIRCDGYLSYLQLGSVNFRPNTNMVSGSVISQILTGAAEGPPLLSSWRLGMPGLSVLGTSTTLGAASITVDTGAQTFAYVGDTWSDNTSPYAAIREVMEAERGLFFEKRDGSLRMFDRNYFVNDLQTAVDGTWDGTYIRRGGGQYTYGDNLINAISIGFNARELDSAISVLGKGKQVRIDPGGSRTVEVSYRDSVGNPIGGLNPIAPLPGTDFKAVRRPSGDMTKYITATIIGYGDRASITFRNSNTISTAFVLSGWQVRGQKFTDYGRQTITVTDSTTTKLYGPRPGKSLSISLLQDQDEAEQLANVIINRDKVPRGGFKSVGFYGNYDNAHMLEVRDRTIGDRIALTEGQTGVSGEYWIVGHTHEWRPGNVHQFSVVLQPVPATTAWILGVSGYSEVGQTTIAA